MIEEPLISAMSPLTPEAGSHTATDVSQVGSGGARSHYDGATCRPVY